MKQSLKLGLMVLVVALLAASGLALAQDTEPDDVAPIEELSEDRHRFGRGHKLGLSVLEGVVEILDITEDELKNALGDGSTLAEVAEANGLSSDDLIAELIVLAQTTLDEAVADGAITQEQADSMLARITEMLPEAIEKSFDDWGHRHGHRHRVGKSFVGDEVSEILDLDKREIHDLLESGSTGQGSVR